MKKKNLLFAALLLVAGGGTGAVAQSPAQGDGYMDVTADYLQNADFETEPIAFQTVGGTPNPLATASSDGRAYEVPGWTGPEKKDAWARWGTAKYGMDLGSPDVLNGIVFPYESERKGAYLALSGAYEGEATQYQTVTLPPGNYALVYEAYNMGVENGVGKNFFGFEPQDGTAVYSARTSYPAEWITDTVFISLSSESTVNVKIGLRGIGGGSGSQAKLAVDNVRLLYKELGAEQLAAPLAEAAALLEAAEGMNYAKTALEKAVADANAYMESSTGNLLDVLNALSPWPKP